SLAPGGTETDLTTMDVGARYMRDQPGEALPLRLNVSPLVRFGTSGSASFERYTVGLAAHQLTRGPLELDWAAKAGHTTSDTPVFEWLSLGGTDSVRGFRQDDVLARTLWNLQSEVWVPVPATGQATGGPRLFLRRSVRIALF